MDSKEIEHNKKWKYAKAEIERKFLLLEKPEGLEQLPYKKIEDKYLDDTCLRLRKTIQDHRVQYKLSKKLPIQSGDNTIQWVSTIYLSEREHEIFSNLSGKHIKKKRYYFIPKSGEAIGIDEIELKDRKIWIAEIEFEEGQDTNYSLPFKYEREITQEESYLGSELAKHYLEE